MSEVGGGMRSNVIRLLKPYDAVAVENPTYPGTPDVNYVGGWIELKWVRDFPARKDTIVKIDHYTKEQKLWLRRRHLKGGKVHLLLQCKREWFIFDYPSLLEVGELTKDGLIKNSKYYTNVGMTREKLIKWLD